MLWCTPSVQFNSFRAFRNSKRVYHPDARVPRTTWKAWGHGQFKEWMDYLLSFWRGERNLFLTLCVGLLFAKFPDVFLGLIAPESMDWTVSYGRVMWAAVLVLPVALFCAVVFAVSMTRSTLRAWKRPLGMLWATALYVLVIPLAPWIFIANYAGEMVAYWWANVRGKYEAITVYAYPPLGRPVLKGESALRNVDPLEEVERLLALATTQPPGPVYLEVAGSLIRKPAPTSTPAKHVAVAAKPDSAALEKARAKA